MFKKTFIKLTNLRQKKMGKNVFTLFRLRQNLADTLIYLSCHWLFTLSHVMQCKDFLFYV